jgi:hypothetical protein
MLDRARSSERQAKALELHLAGASYLAIAKAVGYATKSGAYKAVQAALTAQQQRANVAEAVRAELARLDAMLTGLWAMARRGDVQAVDRVLKIGERRTTLLAMSGDPEQQAARETALDEFTRRLQDRQSASAARRTAEH